MGLPSTVITLKEYQEILKETIMKITRKGTDKFDTRYKSLLTTLFCRYKTRKDSVSKLATLRNL